MKVSMDASQFKLPEGNQALKQGQKSKGFGFKNVVQKYERLEEMKFLKKNFGFKNVGQKSEKESEFGMQDVGKISEKGSEFGSQDVGQKGGTINVFA